MEDIKRRDFIVRTSTAGVAVAMAPHWSLGDALKVAEDTGVHISTPQAGEDIFAYLNRQKGGFDLTLYRQIIGAANEFKEGDLTQGVAAADSASRENARLLLANTTLAKLRSHPVYRDAQYDLIQDTTVPLPHLHSWTLQDLKGFILTQPEGEIKKIMPALSSDIIGCVVKLMSNEELTKVGQTLFNPLPGSKIGSKGYLSARVQPNSPTDNVEDIMWQVFDAWSYGVGDLVLGTNPVSSEPDSVAAIEATLFDLITTFGLEDTLPNCVLSHIDIQAEVEAMHPGTTGIWFQSLAGTVAANATFDVTLEKMQNHAQKRTGRYGIYAETGQGADFTNGHGAGFDMVLHESRKYGFLRALKSQMEAATPQGQVPPWVHVNDVAGFIGPEVFKSREQLVRCCLEDTVMGKLHGLTIGLDICSTLHMDVTLDDLDWCIDQVMPANPGYLMALPTKNDPMLSYLTTAYTDHVRVREKFGYRVNDAMWAFFRKLGIIGADDQPTQYFGDPKWVYYQYLQAKGDTRSREEIYQEGSQRIREIRGRGVPISEGYGEEIWQLTPELNAEVHHLYEDAKTSLWTEFEPSSLAFVANQVPLVTKSENRKDYVYHPESGEQLSRSSVRKLNQIREGWGGNPPAVQIIISDGLNVRSLTDEGHLPPFLTHLRNGLTETGYQVAKEHVIIRHGRVRAGYACGEVLYGPQPGQEPLGVIHIIGERPGSGHHNFSAYLTAEPPQVWRQSGTVDHNLTRVVSGISDTALTPNLAAAEVVKIFDGMMKRRQL
ncbi:MAG: ethanolamine ammonia-lyase subunit EutB [Bacteroidota bacterium]